MIQDDLNFEEELLKRDIGFCIYANLNERAYHNEEEGYDRSKDDPKVSVVCFLLFCLS